MVKPEHQRELFGVGLAALGLFVLLALVPVGWLGGLGARWFPSGNLMGTVGRGVQHGGMSLFGASVALVPFLIGLGGARVAGWLDPARVRAWAVLATGLLVLLPMAFHVLAFSADWTGVTGVWFGGWLMSALGRFGAGFVLAVFLVLLSLATLGWNPLRRPLAWSVEAGHATWSRWIAWTKERQAEDPPARADMAPEPPGTVAEGPPEPVEAKARIERSGRDSADGELPDFKDPRELAGDELPPLHLLAPPTVGDRHEMERELDGLGDVLVEKLRTFNVDSRVSGRTTGPVVTQFEVEPAPGVKVNRIANLDRDLALAMRARTVRIVAPIPGKGAVGVEIPNPVAATVHLREILESRAFGGSHGDLPLALGKDLHGSPYVADLARMPHALIAGATGSGKSVCLNTIITSLVYRHTPETLRLLLVDPKMVELSTYADLPHLRHPVVTDPKDAAGVLKWATLEMERRYALLSQNGVRSIGEFNRRVKKGVPLRRAEPRGDEEDPDRWIYDDGILPFVVLVVDELADLMMSVQSEVEKPLTMLAQKARAVGIHLIVATQRPSVNVITGLIKANFPCRMAFRVASKTDSRTILDQNGADALLGDGDMLFLPPGQSAPIRIQGAFISTEETERLLDWYREMRTRKLAEDGEEPARLEEEDILELVRSREAEESGADDDAFGGDWDELFKEAAETCIRSEQGSTSLLQRRLRIGYGRAARIVDQLHDAGVLGPPDGSKPREVLMSMDQLSRMMSGSEE